MIEIQPYKQPTTFSKTAIEVLHFLVGTQWNQRAMNYIYGLNPSKVRVITGSTKSDSMVGRVTVFVGDSGIIGRIEQEIRVGCDGFNNADEMDMSIFMEK